MIENEAYLKSGDANCVERNQFFYQTRDRPLSTLVNNWRTKGRSHEKQLLFFWILSKWGGEGPAQIFVTFS